MFEKLCNIVLDQHDQHHHHTYTPISEKCESDKTQVCLLWFNQGTFRTQEQASQRSKSSIVNSLETMRIFQRTILHSPLKILEYF